MSTYENDHNINVSSSESRNQGDGNQQNLNQIMGNFFQQSAISGNDHEGDGASEINTFRDRLRSLAEENGGLPTEMLSTLDSMLNDPSKKHSGVTDEFFDSLDRVTKKQLKQEDTCAICTSTFLDDDYPLVVKLNRCHHKFDLDCIKPWLTVNSTCPLCRADVLAKKTIEVESDDEEEFDDMYG